MSAIRATPSRGSGAAGVRNCSVSLVSGMCSPPICLLKSHPQQALAKRIVRESAVASSPNWGMDVSH
jgi:hypothetical protein